MFENTKFLTCPKTLNAIIFNSVVLICYGRYIKIDTKQNILFALFRLLCSNIFCRLKTRSLLGYLMLALKFLHHPVPLCMQLLLPSSSTTSSDNISLPSSPTHQECATAGVPDQTLESCEDNSDEINTTSSSQEDRSAGQADVVPVKSGEESSSGDAAASRSVNTGYKMVFDNIDMNVYPRHMTSDKQTRSLHYVQSYVVKDRVNYDNLSNKLPTEVCVFDILPTNEDYEFLKRNFAILLSRVIVKFIPYFTSDHNKLLTKHIPHEHSTEMATKSEIESVI